MNDNDELGGTIGVMGRQVALASAVTPFYGEQAAVPLSVDQSGGLRGA